MPRSCKYDAWLSFLLNTLNILTEAVKPTNANTVLQFELKIFFQSSSARLFGSLRKT